MSGGKTHLPTSQSTLMTSRDVYEDSHSHSHQRTRSNPASGLPQMFNVFAQQRNCGFQSNRSLSALLDNAIGLADDILKDFDESERSSDSR